MGRRTKNYGPLCVVAVALISCGKTADDKNRCTEAALWDGETPAFVEATDAWGLLEIDPRGIRISAVDYDGDGWVDLAVRSGNTDNFAEGTRANWLLRNLGDGHLDTTESSVFSTAGRRHQQGRPGAVGLCRCRQ